MKAGNVKYIRVLRYEHILESQLAVHLLVTKLEKRKHLFAVVGRSGIVRKHNPAEPRFVAVTYALLPDSLSG
jgi:hypothetical protein